MSEPVVSLNTQAVESFMKDYWRRLDEVTAKYVAQCMKLNGYQVPEKGICDKTLKQFSIKLMKKNKKLVVFIVTNKDYKDFKGDTIVRKHIYCEIVKKGVHLGTFKNMIIKRFPKVVSNYSTWEGCDYAKVYGLIGAKKNEKV